MWYMACQYVARNPDSKISVGMPEDPEVPAFDMLVD
jgi:hypothetical protein